MSLLLYLNTMGVDPWFKGSDKILSLRTIVKDIGNHGNNENNAIELSIYNLIPFQISLDDIEKSKILCKDTIICIKEPLTKFYKSNQMGLRMDNPYYNLVIINKMKSKNDEKHKQISIETIKLICIEIIL